MVVMRKTVVAMCVYFMLSPILSAQTLVGSWQFSGNANDATGNGMNGTIYNATLTAGEAGVPNTAYKFNGTNAHIDFPYNSLLNLSLWTIESVVRVDGFNSDPCQSGNILSRGTSYGYDAFGIGFNDNSHDHSCAAYSPNYTEFIAGAAGTVTGGWHDANYIQLGVWYHYTATYNGTILKLYLNGLAIDSLAWANQYNYSVTQPGMSFGYYPAGAPSYPYWFNGAIDRLDIWSGVLPDAQILAHSNGLYPNSITITQPFTDTAKCAGASLSIPYVQTGIYNNGNVFSAQLSNTSGSFANPITIGNFSSTMSGVITCTIPAATTTGTGYRVRIVSTAPADTSNDNGSNIDVYNTAQFNVVIVSAPATYAPGVNMIFTAVATGGFNYTYQWQINGFNITGATANVFSATSLRESDQVTVVVTSTAPCGSSVLTSNAVSLGLAKVASMGNFNIFPNPAQDEITIEGKGTNAQLQLYDMAGRQLFTKMIQFSNGAANVHFGLAAGVYNLHLIDENGNLFTDRLVIVK